MVGVGVTLWLTRDEPVSREKAGASVSGGAEPGQAGEMPQVDENTRGKRERTDATTPKRTAANHFEAVAEVSPELLQRLNFSFALLDSSMDANVSTWEMLGIDSETAKGVADGIKQTLVKLNKQEAITAQRLEHSDTVTKFYLPRLDPAVAAPIITEIEGRFETVFGKALSQQLTKSLLDRSPETAGLAGKDRVITVTLTSDEVLEKTQRSYEVRWQVMLENNIPLSERLKNIDSMSSYNGTAIFEETPDYLKELIDQKKQ